MSDKDELDRIRREVKEHAEAPEIGGARWQFDLHWLIGQIDKRDELIATLTKGEVTEWGIKGITPSGNSFEHWGFREDPRTTGVLDDEGYIELNGSGYGFYQAFSVGQRIKTTEKWEAL